MALVAGGKVTKIIENPIFHLFGDDQSLGLSELAVLRHVFQLGAFPKSPALPEQAENQVAAFLVGFDFAAHQRAFLCSVYVFSTRSAIASLIARSPRSHLATVL